MNTNEKINPLPLIELQSGNSSIRINPQGGLVESLKLNNQQIFWSGVRPDGSNASSHLSIPWFGPYKGELPEGQDNPGYHGPGRKSEWATFDRQERGTQLTLQIPGLEKIYPNLHAYSSYLVTDNSYYQLLTLDNRHHMAQSGLNPAYHWYWNIPAKLVGEVEINGQKYQPEKWYSAELVEARRENIIKVPGMGTFEVEQSGFSKIALWTQEEADFSCIEVAQDPGNIREVDPLPSNDLRHYWASITPISE